MKTKLLGVATAIRLSWLVGAGLLVSASPAAATTFFYSGDDGTSFSCSGSACSLGLSYSPISVSFGYYFDMSGMSGSFGLSPGPAVLGFGTLTVGDEFITFLGSPYPLSYLYINITLSNGVVTDWSIAGGGDNYYHWSVVASPSGYVFNYINAADGGQIVTGSGLGVLSSDLTANPTPLPAALPLFASGLGALGLLGWRRKRKAAA